MKIRASIVALLLLGASGCGRVKVSTSGNFNDRDMHLLAGLTSDCLQARLSGDLSR
jgi:hypothetical protein